MKRFAEGQEYIITSNARPMGIACVVEADGSRATFELSRGGETRRFTERIRTVGKPPSEAVVPAEYDAIYAYDALSKRKQSAPRPVRAGGASAFKYRAVWVALADLEALMAPGSRAYQIAANELLRAWLALGDKAATPQPAPRKGTGQSVRIDADVFDAIAEHATAGVTVQDVIRGVIHKLAEDKRNGL